MKNTVLLFCTLFLLAACQRENTDWLNYKIIKDRILHGKHATVSVSDTANMFDEESYDPRRSSVDRLIDTLQQIYENDSVMLSKLNVTGASLLTKDAQTDSTISNLKDSFTADIKKTNVEEIRALRYNLKQLNDADSILNSSHEVKKGRENSRVWARVSKKDQRLYLYLDGKLVDTFKVSTGDKRHETPNFDMQPMGPIFQKYTSKKYPGGNYNGLGNMPYVVFVRGGYALHGTTRGNIPKLGTKASHGCVRLHPDNAKVFNELVRKAGLENTWVTIE